MEDEHDPIGKCSNCGGYHEKLPARNWVDAQMIPAIVLPEPKPFYGIEWSLWVTFDEGQREEAKITYLESADALKSIYAALLSPIAVVK